MIQQVLPDTVTSEHSFADLDGALHPAEETAVTRAVAKRQNEFRTTRICAHHALRRLGVPDQPIRSGHRGAPQWPDGVVGSMTHCAGYRAAAVARRAEVYAVGIDAEPNGALPDGVLDLVTVDGEVAHLAALPAGPEVCWDRLLFSAKEAVFKAWYPTTGRELSFREAELRFDPDRRTFTARLLVGGSPFDAILAGRWQSGRGILVTAVTVLAAC